MVTVCVSDVWLRMCVHVFVSECAGQFEWEPQQISVPGSLCVSVRCTRKDIVHGSVVSVCAMCLGFPVWHVSSGLVCGVPVLVCEFLGLCRCL